MTANVDLNTCGSINSTIPASRKHVGGEHMRFWRDEDDDEGDGDDWSDEDPDELDEDNFDDN